MGRLESYLGEKYQNEKEQYESVKELIERVIPIYGMFYKEKGWGYKLFEEPGKKSTSTIAMVAFSMSVLMGEKLDLLTDETCVSGVNYFSKYKDNNKAKEENENKEKDGDMNKTYNEILEEALSILFGGHNVNKDENKDYFFESSTFGKDDPFTLMWARYLIDNNDYKASDIIDNFKATCKKKVAKILYTLYTNYDNLKYSNNLDSYHIFPLLKTVQLYNSIINIDYEREEAGFWNDMAKEEIKDYEENLIKISKDKMNSYINSAINKFRNCLHHHLSLANIENSNFDTAELVFSLEGLLILDSNKDNFDQNLLNRVFDVVKNRQNISLYWRPLKPIVSDERGSALLPLSVEIAMSLIRICRLLGKRGEELFSRYYEIFEKYTEWLKTRISIVRCNYEKCDDCDVKQYCFYKNSNDNNKVFYGWCSEHVYQPDVIHPWETSQVLVYLVNFNDMLKKHIANQLLKYANFSIKYPKSDDKPWLTLEDWDDNEPVCSKSLDVYKNIWKFFVDSHKCEETESKNKYYSMLLYGPPGTGKTTIAEKIAEAKGWPLITITPSDFIASGADFVENRAKNIFTVLEEQEKKVILFDEIDRLILDRDSEYYNSQSDMFQFMTPSMLVKLNNLRKKQKLIFIIATNYEDRIDMAVKRKGRIDEKFLILPYDWEGRNKLFNKYIKNKLKVKEHKDFIEELRYFIVLKTVLYTRGEFLQLAERIRSNIDLLIENKDDIKNELSRMIEKPVISLINYKNRIKDDKNAQKPYKEFIGLLYLKSETKKKAKEHKEQNKTENNDLFDDSIFDDNELDFVTEFLSSEGMLNKTVSLSDIKKYENELKIKFKEYAVNEEATETILEGLCNYKSEKENRRVKKIIGRIVISFQKDGDK